MTKEVTDTWIVEETTRLYDLTILESGSITAPEGRFVYMTVDGVGKDIKPGRYRGDIVLSVAETYHMTPHSLLRMTNRTAVPCILLGVLIAAAIVSLVTFGVIHIVF